MKTPNENEDGLLHHEHSDAAENPFNPDERAVEETASPELIEEAVSESHHGLIREFVPEPLRMGREEEAKTALENTEISRATGWFLTLAFLLTIFSIPIIQMGLEVSSNLGERRDEAANGQPVTTGVLPRAFDALQELPSWEKIGEVRSWQNARDLIPDAARLKSHEETLEDESFISKWLLPRAQGMLVKIGVGTEQVYLGRRDANQNPWLFYRPDVDYLSSKGFLDPALQRVRARAGDESSEAVQPDPIRAIVDFHNQLAARNIELVILPMPVKPSIEPEKISAHYQRSTSDLQNPSYSQFLQSLAQNKILVFDPSSILRERKQQTGQPQFLQTDTHWTPDAMQGVARELATFLVEKTELQKGQAEYSVREKSIQNLGDTAGMLSLPDDQKLFAAQSVTISQVFDAQNQLWKSDKNARILLLGDSFCNIYSLAGMGWGGGAGFGAQLSFWTKQPVDAVVVNAGGSHTSRQRLMGEMQRDRNRLKNKKVVVWEFSMRDLLIGDWKIFKLPPASQ